MNNLYFACTDCLIYADAGYRWAYWELLKPGIVAWNQSVDVDRVMAASGFWNPPQNSTSTWLDDEVLPVLRRFLPEHRNHHLVFWDSNEVPEDALLAWLQIGRLPNPTARYFAETLGLTTWEAVTDHDRTEGYGSLEFLLYDDDAAIAAFRKAFDGWVAKRRSSDPESAA